MANPLGVREVIGSFLWESYLGREDELSHLREQGQREDALGRGSWTNGVWELDI